MWTQNPVSNSVNQSVHQLRRTTQKGNKQARAEKNKRQCKIQIISNIWEKVLTFPLLHYPTQSLPSLSQLLVQPATKGAVTVAIHMKHTVEVRLPSDSCPKTNKCTKQDLLLEPIWLSPQPYESPVSPTPVHAVLPIRWWRQNCWMWCYWHREQQSIQHQVCILHGEHRCIVQMHMQPPNGNAARVGVCCIVSCLLLCKK